MKFRIQNSKFRISFISLLLTGIVLLAAFLRLYRIQDYMTFLGDEGRDVLVAYNILHGHFTLLGPTASIGGFYFGPIYYYFMAPFLLLFNYNPVGPAIMVGIIGTITVWLVYKLGSLLFNKPVGVIAAVLYAIAPVIISYSRSSWNPNPLPFFSILVLYFLYNGLKEEKNKFLLFAGICLGIAIELHFISFVLGFIVFVYVLFFELYFRKLSLKKHIFILIKKYAIIFAGFILGWLPYLGFEVRHGFVNTRSFFAFIFHSGKISGENANFFANVSSVFFRIFGRLVTNFPAPEQIVWKNPTITIQVWFYATLLLGVISTGVFLVQLWHSWKKKDKSLPKKSLVFFWLLCGVLIFGIYKRQIYDYYFAFLYPLPFFLVGNLLYTFFSKNFWTKPLAIVIFSWLVYVNLLGIPFRYEPNRQLQQVETIARFVDSKTEGKPFNFALITGGNSDHAYRYFFTLWHHEPIAIQNTIVDPKRKSVTDQLLVVCESIPCYPLGHPLFEIAGFGRAEIVGHWNVLVVEVYKLIHYRGQ